MNQCCNATFSYGIAALLKSFNTTFNFTLHISNTLDLRTVVVMYHIERDVGKEITENLPLPQE
jgi:hypothetical protein